MLITRRVLAILAVVATLFLVAPAPTRADPDPAQAVALVQLVADSEGACALTVDGDLYCWGAGYPDPYAPVRNLLGLVTVGVLLVTGGTTLLLLTRSAPPAHPEEAEPSA